VKNENYRKQIDSIQYDNDFEEKTLNILSAERQHGGYHMSGLAKRIIIIAAAAVILCLTAAASIMFLSASNAAEFIGDEKLAKAFEEDGAVKVSETIKTGGYDITLLVLVSGKGLSDTYDTASDKTYAVISVAASDGTPYTNEDYPSLAFTPLISGLNPWQFNAWTLHGGYTQFCEGGILYYLFDCDGISCFADRTVYFAVYDGFTPSREFFNIAKDGSISFSKDFDKAAALFTLPLDKSLADKDAAQRLIEENDIPVV